MASGSNGTTTVHARARFPTFSIVGCALAGYCSWTLNASVGWAAIHAIFGWAYMLYLCAGCGGGLPDGVF